MVSEQRQAERLAIAPSRSTQFRAAFDSYFDRRERQLSNQKKAKLRSAMEANVFPSKGKRATSPKPPRAKYRHPKTDLEHDG